LCSETFKFPSQLSRHYAGVHFKEQILEKYGKKQYCAACKKSLNNNLARCFHYGIFHGLVKRLLKGKEKNTPVKRGHKRNGEEVRRSQEGKKIKPAMKTGKQETKDLVEKKSLTYNRETFHEQTLDRSTVVEQNLGNFEDAQTYLEQEKENANVLRRKEEPNGDKKFTCSMCSSSFKHRSFLYAHYSYAHFKTEIYERFNQQMTNLHCEQCNQDFSIEPGALYHFGSIHGMVELLLPPQFHIAPGKQIKPKKAKYVNGNKRKLSHFTEGSRQIIHVMSEQVPDEVEREVLEGNKHTVIKKTAEKENSGETCHEQTLDRSTVMEQNLGNVEGTQNYLKQENDNAVVLKRKEEPNGDKFTCSMCSSSFKNRSLLYTHYSYNHFKMEIYERFNQQITYLHCKECNQDFSMEQGALKHFGSIHGIVELLLPRQFHVAKAAPGRKRMCSSKEASVDFASKKKKVQMTDDVHQHTSTSKMFDCAFCLQTYPKQPSLYRHYAATHFSEQIKETYGAGPCPQCGVHVNSEVAILWHMTFAHNMVEKILSAQLRSSPGSTSHEQPAEADQASLEENPEEEAFRKNRGNDEENVNVEETETDETNLKSNIQKSSLSAFDYRSPAGISDSCTSLKDIETKSNPEDILDPNFHLPNEDKEKISKDDLQKSTEEQSRGHKNTGDMTDAIRKNAGTTVDTTDMSIIIADAPSIVIKNSQKCLTTCTGTTNVSTLRPVNHARPSRPLEVWHLPPRDHSGRGTPAESNLGTDENCNVHPATTDSEGCSNCLTEASNGKLVHQSEQSGDLLSHADNQPVSTDKLSLLISDTWAPDLKGSFSSPDSPVSKQDLCGKNLIEAEESVDSSLLTNTVSVKSLLSTDASTSSRHCVVDSVSMMNSAMEIPKQNQHTTGSHKNRMVENMISRQLLFKECFSDSEDECDQ
jgi:transcription elongation factor Elf1